VTVKATLVWFHGLASVEHPPEAASLRRGPEKTHVALLLFWSNNAGPFRFQELAFGGPGKSGQRVSSLKGGPAPLVSNPQLDANHTLLSAEVSVSGVGGHGGE
jgi:hypothetical protein